MSSYMNIVISKERLARLLCVSPCFLMSILACYQFYLVVSGQLDAWKGGGFGMFSSVYSLDKRRFAVTLIMTDGQRERFPFDRIRGRFRGVEEVSQLERDVLLKPTHAALNRLATVLANFEWVAVGRNGSPLSGPDEGDRLKPMYCPRTHAPAGVQASPVAIGGLDLELFEYDYNQNTKQLVLHKLMGVSMPAGADRDTGL